MTVLATISFHMATLIIKKFLNRDIILSEIYLHDKSDSQQYLGNNGGNVRLKRYSNQNKTAINSGLKGTGVNQACNSLSRNCNVDSSFEKSC